jgi:hypothetical protein
VGQGVYEGRVVMAQNKEEMAAYKKAWGKANKEKIAARKKVYYEANKESILALQRAYKEANKEKIAVTNKARYQANREVLLANQKAYAAANKEKVAATQKAYVEANKEKVAAYKKAYVEANREAVTARVAKRRALKRKQVPVHLRDCPHEKKRLLEIYKLRTILSEATGVQHHVDHMWPLADGGPHWSGNLQVIPAEENLSKNASVCEETRATIIKSLYTFESERSI